MLLAVHFRETTRFVQLVPKHESGKTATDAVYDSKMPVVLVGEHDKEGTILTYKVFVSAKILFRGKDVNEALFYWLTAHYVFNLKTDEVSPKEPTQTYTFGKKNPKQYTVHNRVTCTVHLWAGYILRIQNALTPGSQAS